MRRREFIKIAGLAIGAATTACVPQNVVDILAGEPTKSPTKEIKPTATEQPVPFLPETKRLSNKELPKDIISKEILWKSFHTRIWSSSEMNLFLRPGVEETRLFRELNSGDKLSLDIVMLEKGGKLTPEQREYINPELVKARDDFIRGGGIGSGLYLGVNGHYGIFVCRYTKADDPKHYDISYPEYVDQWIATWNTAQTTVNHEILHGESEKMSGDHEAAVGISMMIHYKEAWEKMKRGDDSGYFVVIEAKDMVVVA